MIRKKSTKFKNFPNFFSSNCSHGEVESSLKAPLTFFRQPPESFLWKKKPVLNETFPYKIPKIFCSSSEKDWKNNLSKNFCLKSFSLDSQISFLITQLKFFPTRFPKKFRLLSKKIGKRYVLKTIFLSKLFPWTRKMQFQPTRQKTDVRPKTSAQCLKMMKNFICFPKQFFLNNSFYRYGECSFERPAKLFPLNYCK